MTSATCAEASWRIRATWKNPAPEVRVQKIDFVSSANEGASGSAPFLIAITAEAADTPEFWLSQSEELGEKGDFAEAITALDRAVKGLSTSPELWRAKGQLLEKVSQSNEALRAYTKAIDVAAVDINAFSRVLTQARLERAALHQRANRLDEAAADNLAAYGIPPRHSQARLGWVDLDLFYNGELGRRLGVPLEGEAAQTFAAAVRGVTGGDFDLRGVVRVAGTNWVQQGRTPAPAAVTAIPVNRRFTRMLILHGTNVRERDGIQIGTYVLHYADGRKEEIGIVYGEDMRDKWCCSPGDDGATRATVAWTGENDAVKKWRTDGSLRFYLRNWNNPVLGWRSKVWISSRQ